MGRRCCAGTAYNAVAASQGVAMTHDASRGGRSVHLPGYVLDAAVFAPLGILAAASKGVEQLADDGRAFLSRRVLLARSTGELVTTLAWRKLSATLEDLTGPRDAGEAPETQTRTATSSGTAGVDSGPEGEKGSGTGRLSESVAGVAEVDERDPRDLPRCEDLAITGYDTLAASQVVGRLNGLDDTDLELIERYEMANRRRRTVLSRLSQLRNC